MQFLRLTYILAIIKFKLRNEGSYLGILWYLLNPILMFGLLLLVFSRNLGYNIPSYPVFLLLGIIIYNFFQQATIESTRILDEYRLMIKSIKFPHEALVAAIVLKTFFSHVFEIIILAVIMVFYQLPLFGLVYYPLIAICFMVFITGVGLLLSALTAYLADLENIWLFITRLLWFATPIFYSLENQPLLQKLNLLNPLYYFITTARQVVIYQIAPDMKLIIGMLISAITVIIVGLIIFKKLKVKFAEMI